MQVLEQTLPTAPTVLLNSPSSPCCQAGIRCAQQWQGASSKRSPLFRWRWTRATDSSCQQLEAMPVITEVEETPLSRGARCINVCGFQRDWCRLCSDLLRPEVGTPTTKGESEIGVENDQQVAFSKYSWHVKQTTSPSGTASHVYETIKKTEFGK